MDRENGQAQDPVVQKDQGQVQTQSDNSGTKVSPNANAGNRNRPERTRPENDTIAQRDGQPRAGRNRNNRRDNRVRRGDEERVQQAGQNGNPAPGSRNGTTEGGRAPSGRRERSERPGNEGASGTERARTPRPGIEARLQKKRVETVEDIQADIERITHDIDFEIKQIQTIRLGM